MNMAGVFLSFLKKLQDVWGREVDQSSWSWTNTLPPQENPDDTTSEDYFDVSQNPQVVAGMAYSDVSHLFVSARGIEDQKTGSYFPPQLIWTTPELAGEDIFDMVGWQFDEEFEGGFSEIIRSTDGPCKTYGHQPIEFEWYIRDRNPFKGKAFVKMAYARDPHKYEYDYKGKPGIYQKQGYGDPKRMNPQNFQSYAYNPLFNNPYGTSINRPLKSWIETFNKVFGYWRHALEKAGMGSWVAYGKDSWFYGKNNVFGQKMIDKVITQLKLLKSGTYTIFPESAQLKNEKLQLEAQAFLDWYTAFCEVVSLIYTGTTGALKEEEYGARAAKESTDVREKSQKEKFNAMRVQNFWTWKFIPRFCAVNFRPSQIRSTPTLQLIPINLITPTTPKDQDTQDEVRDGDGEESQQREKIEVRTKKDEKSDESQEMMGIELQEEGEKEKPYTPPVAIPPGYVDFPSTEPVPLEYQEGLEAAKAYLAAMPVKNFPEVQPGEAHQIFTVKRLRSFDDPAPLLEELKQAIIPTLGESEYTAWSLYWTDAIAIFQSYGLEKPSPELRSSLIASFRQARQNALNEGFYQNAKAKGAVGLRLKENPTVKEHHLDEIPWKDIAIPIDHQELQVGGRLRIPMNFGCVHTYEAVFDLADLTPESEWPEKFPGETYKYYAQPAPEEGKKENEE
jgi:hypothetical protein